MKKLIVCGAKGRMGTKICELALDSDEWEIVGEVDRNSPLEDCIEEGEVIIDFTLPEGTLVHVAQAIEHQKPIVIGTTGFTEKQLELFKHAAKKIPLLYSPNMSVGVNLLFKLTEIAAKALPGYGIEISETHHVHKKDKPSGTAKKIAEVVKTVRGEEPPIESIREGEVVGEHTIFFGSEREHLAILHRAIDRAVFAEGALKAAKWLVGKPAGFYNMLDVLEIASPQRGSQ